MAFAMIIVIIGFLMLFNELGIIDEGVWRLFWPLLVIFIGLSMMYKRMHGRTLFDLAGDSAQPMGVKKARRRSMTKDTTL